MHVDVYAYWFGNSCRFIVMRQRTDTSSCHVGSSIVSLRPDLIFGAGTPPDDNADDLRRSHWWCSSTQTIIASPTRYRLEKRGSVHCAQCEVIGESRGETPLIMTNDWYDQAAGQLLVRSRFS